MLARAFEVRAAIADGAAPEGPLRRFLYENVEPGFVPRSPEVEAALDAIARHVDARGNGRETRFARLVRLADLDAIAQDLLLSALAPTVRRGFREARTRSVRGYVSTGPERKRSQRPGSAGVFNG